MRQDDGNGVAEMLQAHPQHSRMVAGGLGQAVETIFRCAAVCTSCADACLGEPKVQQLVRCIRLNLDCADICQATARVLARMTETNPTVLRMQLQACATACRSCGDECAMHAQMHEHCAVCADICQATARVLARMTETNPTVLRMQLQACATVCRSCGDECAMHAQMHEHCAVCAEACRQCEQACQELQNSL